MPPLAVNEFTGALAELSARSGDAAAKLIGRIGGLTAAEGRQFVTDAYPALLDPFLSASGELTAQWYAEQPAAPLAKGAAAFAPSPAALPDPKQLGISARWAMTQADAEMALRGNAIRSTMNASRDTVIANATTEGVRWVRHAQPNACGFCRMLATRRGADSYRSKEGALTVVGRSVNLETSDRRMIASGAMTREQALARRDQISQTYQTNSRFGQAGQSRTRRLRGNRGYGQKYHDHCKCTAIPVRDGIYDPPDYVQQWEQDYKDAFRPGIKGAEMARALDVPRIRQDRLAAKLAKSLPDAATEAARLQEIAKAALPPPPATPPPGDSVADILNTPVDEIDRLISEGTAALEAGDDVLADELFGRAQKLERAQEVKAERAAKARETRATKRDAENSAKWQRVSELIDQGTDPIEAESTVFGRSMESIWRREFMAKAKKDGYHGETVGKVIREMYAEFSSVQYYRMEAATNGQFIKRKYVDLYDSRDLWSMSDATARKVISDEAAQWFDDNGGRVTFNIFRKSVLDGSGTFDTVMQQDFLQ